MSLHNCENCRIRAYATRKPKSIIAKLWRWHTGWCPGWKAYQKALAQEVRTAEDSEPADSPPDPT